MIIPTKKKEPILSENFQNMLYRATGDLDYKARTLDIQRFKFKIFKKLTQNQDLLHALHSEEFGGDNELNGDLFRDVHIFSFMKLPDHKTNVKNYVCFDVTKENYNKPITVITFRAISHIDDYQTDWGINRQDLLAEIITHEFNWTNEFGMHFELQYDSAHTTNDGYIWRELRFVADSINDAHNKININVR